MTTSSDAALHPNEEFLLQERAAMHERVARNIQDMNRVETLVPLAVAVLYAWLAKDGSSIQASKWIYWMAPIFIAFGALRQEVRYQYIKVAELYTRKIEAHVYGSRPGAKALEGWERFWDGNGTSWHRYLRRSMWAFFLVATTVVAVCGGLG